MKSYLTGFAALLLATGAAHAQTHDADFPEQMRAVNTCYVNFIATRKSPTNSISDQEMFECMEAQGFRFCANCKIFRYSGGLCRNDKENGSHRPTCWRYQ
jgi:hypothetical protein